MGSVSVYSNDRDLAVRVHELPNKTDTLRAWRWTVCVVCPIVETLSVADAVERGAVRPEFRHLCRPACRHR